MTDETVITNEKPFYTSKILWLSLVAIFLGAAEQLNGLAEFLPENVSGIYTSVLGVLILIARFFSSASLTLKK